jgi:chitinase
VDEMTSRTISNVVGFMTAIAMTASLGACSDPGGAAAGPRRSNAANGAGGDQASSAGPDGRVDGGPGSATDAGPDSGSARPLAVSAYYAGYTESILPLAAAPFAALDSLVHFSVLPNADGSLDDASNVLPAASGAATTAAAHAAGVTATLCVGGAGTQTAFLAATQPAVRATFVANIVSAAEARGYDGVDLDWEPLQASDASQFQALVRDVRAKLDALGGPHRLLTAAVITGTAMSVAPIAASLDRIHLMAYDLSGPYPGWVTWHNAPLTAGGGTFPGGGPLPSVTASIDELLAAGVPAATIHLGIDHIGYSWTGGVGPLPVTAPQRAWTTTIPTYAPVTYRTVADELLTPERAKWDDIAHVPYLSIPGASTATDAFVSYEDARSQREKVELARSKGLGGVFVWELSASYRPNGGPDERNALMTSLYADAKGAAK